LVTATNGTIQAGSNTLTGTLTFGGGLSESGGVVNKFILSSNPNGPNNDLISVTGNLTLSGLNTVSVSGSLPNGANYTLFQYSGSLGGSVANLTLTGATGYLTNIANTIVLHTLATTRGPTNITWVGNSVNNYWDTSVTTNWVNTGVLDYFIASDNVIFSNTGGNNPFVSIVGSVTPNSAVVNTASNYVFAGTGSIDGSASLTVSNGSLTILTTNNYTGPTTLAGGIIATPLIANSLTASGIGAASTDPANLVFNGGTLFYFGGNFVTDHGVTFTNAGGTIDVTNGTTLTLGGVIVGNGVLSKTDTGSLTLNMANTYSGGTVVSNGTLTLNNASSAGTGTINLYGGNLALGAVKPANTINVAGNAEVTGANSSGNTGIKNVTGNSNLLLNVSGGTTFDLTGDMGAYSGTITLSNGGGAFVRLNGSIGSPLATWNLGTSPMDLNVRSGSTSNNLGALTGVAGTTLTGRTGSGNTGSTTYYIGANNMNSTFYGVIQNGGANANSVTKVGSGTLTLAGQNTYTGGTTVSSGTLALTNLSGTDGSIADSATINLQSGAFIDVTGLIAPALQLSSSTAQLLEGSGTVRGQINVGAASTIAPGGGLNGALGTLTATNTIALNGTAWMKLDRSASPNSDHLVVSSSSAGINYGGTLTVTNAGGTLQSGDNFTIFSAAGGLAGSFSATNLPALNSGLAWNFNPTAGTLTVVSGVNTTPTNITATVSGNTLTLSWPVDHTGWHLQAQTNSLGSGLGINWITIPGTDASNTYNVTLNPANPTVFYRMVYP
jgi:autotransporter-associated beta strand protein